MSDVPAAERKPFPEKPFRCLAFDAVGTLIHPEPSVGQAYFDAARRHGSRLPLEEIRARFRQVFHETERNDIDGPTAAFHGDPEAALRTSEPHERQRWRYIVSRVVDDIADTDSLFEELYVHFARPASWRCFDDTAEALALLAARGYQLAMASNFDERLSAVKAGLPGLSPIGQVVISSEVGYRKPSPGFFKAMFELTRCSPSEVLMIGDDWENDVRGAAAAGVSAVHLDRSGGSGGESIRSLLELADRLPS